MAPRTRAASRRVLRSDSNKNLAEPANQTPASSRLDHADSEASDHLTLNSLRSAPLNSPHSPSESTSPVEATKKSNILVLKLQAEKQLAEPSVTFKPHLHIDNLHQERVALKIPTTSPLNSRSSTPTSIGSRAAYTNDSERGINTHVLENSLVNQTGKQTVTQEQNHLTNQSDDGATELDDAVQPLTGSRKSEEDPKLDRLIKSVHRLLQDPDSFTKATQKPPESRSTAYPVSEATKAIVKRMMEQSDMPTEEVDRLVDLQAQYESAISPGSTLGAAADSTSNGTAAISSGATFDDVTQEAPPPSSKESTTPKGRNIMPGFLIQALDDASHVSRVSTKIASDVKEFEDESSRLRIESRANEPNDDTSDGLELTHKSSSPASNETAHTATEYIKVDSPLRNEPTVQDTRETLATKEAYHEMATSEPQIPNPKEEAVCKLCTDILQSVAKSTKKSFNKGDVAIIIDADDLSRTLMFHSNALSPEIKNALLQGQAGHGAEKAKKHDLTYVLALVARQDIFRMPTLVPFFAVEKAEMDEARKSLYFHRLESARNIKQEPQESGDDSTNVPPLPRLNWIKAYKVFLHIVTDTKASLNFTVKTVLGIFGQDAALAVPLIEGVIEIAKNLGAMHSITATLTLIMYRYSANLSLYSAIAAEAATWLLIGKDIEDEAVFKEALRHVAGSYPAWPWQTPFSSMPDELKATIRSKSRDLKLRQLVAYEELSAVTVLDYRFSNDQVKLPVSPHNKPHKYDVVNIWWHWVIEHYLYVTRHARMEHAGDPEPSPYCDHEDAQCLTVAGFFRAISKKGDSYLQFEEMMENWNRKRYPYSDESAMRQTLSELKAQAAKIVAPLVKSDLQWDQKDTLDYLTSIPVEDKDMPWNRESEAEDGEQA